MNLSLDNELFRTLDVTTLGLIAAVLVLVALAHFILRWWIRRRTSRDAALAGDPATATGVRHWVAVGLRELVPPIALLIWIHGLYAAAGLLLEGASALEWSDTAAVVIRWIYGLAVLASLFWLLSRAGRLIDAFLVSLAARSDNKWDDVMLPLAGKAVRRLLPVLALILAAPALAGSPGVEEVFRNAMSLLLIGVLALVLYQAIDAAASVLLRQYSLDEPDNLKARSVHTQVMVLKKVAVSVIAIFTLASMLMVFDSVRQFGASILASAGIAGIIIGLAAQRSIATLLAGFQIALTQPIRVDDVVIVENEWGRIEDITLTYVVVRIWDLRRLVLPITYFIEQPFQNWTRTSADLLGTVFLYVDYTVPVDAIRSELTRVLEASELWDRKVNVVHVTDAKEHTVEVRLLMSAADAGTAFALRAEVREKLVAFIQREYPESLPRFRATLDTRMPEGAAAG